MGAIGILNHRTPVEELQYRMAKRQKWRTVSMDIDIRYELEILPTPYRIMIDLSSLDPNDAILIEIELEMFKADGEGKIVPNKLIAEQYEIQRLRPTPEGMVTNINEVSVGPSPLVTIEPIEGPWRASVWYTQRRGATKTVRFIVW